jgi:hypothetical protein
MKYFQETTVWTQGTTKNGSYYLSDDKTHMVAYQAPGETEYKWFKSPIRISTKGRKFTVIKNGEPDSKYIVPSTPIAMATQPSNSVTVAGSNGASYLVTLSGKTLTCSCSGFQFRRHCRHLELSGLQS